ncbi:MAG: hypothetical protein ACOVQE_10595, partial [Chitinophagaceae bacterium]
MISKKLLRLFVFLMLIVASLTSSYQHAFAQERIKKVVFQGFWWDYWNENYRFRWADYLTELAPRLKAAGFNAVWIPPAYKNENPDFVGYMPFDNYDLGDKRQKGNGHPLNDRLRTRVGSKNELLRMVAVLHANGLEVVHDIVLNHNGGAGGGVQTYGAPGAAGTAGAGGLDPNPGSTGTAAGWKNFRYVSYASPALDETQNDYWTRNGRWPKNFQNYFNCNAGCNDINSTFWGPDINYDAGAFGRSTNIPQTGSITIAGNTRNYFNPAQTPDYMRNAARDWLIWLKKQTGSDGWRWDAVKHFPISIQEDLIYNSKYNAGFANGGQDMFCVGEWIGGKADVDNYALAVRSGSAPGGVANELHTGAFDFALRGYGPFGGIYSMILGNGGFNMQNLPSSQQDVRFMDYPGGKRIHRSVNFVNSHDTYRPLLSANGNFLRPIGDNSGWNTGSQLGGNGQHIDPREPRLAAGYAVASAMDGNPMFFIEDLFDIGTTGRRFSHLATNTTDLPMRGDLQNIIQCHQRLGFKDGDYGVPTFNNVNGTPNYQSGNAGDHLVIERIGKAIIGVTDAFSSVNNNSADQVVTVTVNNAWPTGTVLYDFSGAHGITTATINASKQVTIRTAPNGHTIPNAFGRGYSVWAPVPAGVTISSVNDLYAFLATYQQPLDPTTTQEWEMADDLGDSHCESLGQGGALPENSTNFRVVGQVFASAGKTITYSAYPERNGSSFTASIWNLRGKKLHQVSGLAANTAPLTGTFTPTTEGWYVIKIHNANNTQARQRAWVRVTYTAPAVVNTRATANADTLNASIWTGNRGTTNLNDCGNWERGRTPSANANNPSYLVIPANSFPAAVINTNMTLSGLMVEKGATLTINDGVVVTVRGNLEGGGTIIGGGKVVVAGSAQQNVTEGDGLTVSNLEVNNAANLVLDAPLNVTTNLNLVNGSVALQNQSLTIANNATITGAASTRYIITPNTAAEGGSLIQTVANSARLFPIGNTRYTPVTLTNSGTSTTVAVRSFESVLKNGTTGAAESRTGKVNKTWVINPTVNTAVLGAVFQWNTADEDGSFNRSLAAVGNNRNQASSIWGIAAASAAASGSNPYTISAPNLTQFGSFGVFSNI